MSTPEPSPAERLLLETYQLAEAHLQRHVNMHYRGVVRGREETEAARRHQAAQQVAAATAAAVDFLDGTIPGLLGEILIAAANRGEAEAVRQLQAVRGGDGYQPGGANLGALDRLATNLIARATEAHGAILRVVPDVFRQALAQVLPSVLVGVDRRRDASQRALWDLTDRGVTRFQDNAGRNWRLSSYVEMAARTGAARAQLDAQHDRLASVGHDLVIVNGSGDRCPRCRPWHGKVLSITGSGARTLDVEHGTRDGETVTVQVAGSVDDARRAGWGHPQCRCSTSVYIPGVTRPRELARDNGQYAARQRQREIERQIRRSKEREVAALDDNAARRAQAQTRAAQARMRDHLAANPDLLRRPYREQIGAGNIGQRPGQVRPAPLPGPRPPAGPAPRPADQVARERQAQEQWETQRRAEEQRRQAERDRVEAERRAEQERLERDQREQVEREEATRLRAEREAAERQQAERQARERAEREAAERARVAREAAERRQEQQLDINSDDRYEILGGPETEGGKAAVVIVRDRVTGEKLVRKKATTELEARHEEAAAELARAMGARVPAVRRDGATTYHQFVEGRTMAAIGGGRTSVEKQWRRQDDVLGGQDTDDLSILVAALGNGDNHLGNLMRDRDGNIWAIDWGISGGRESYTEMRPASQRPSVTRERINEHIAAAEGLRPRMREIYGAAGDARTDEIVDNLRRLRGDRPDPKKVAAAKRAAGKVSKEIDALNAEVHELREAQMAGRMTPQIAAKLEDLGGRLDDAWARLRKIEKDGEDLGPDLDVQRGRAADRDGRDGRSDPVRPGRAREDGAGPDGAGRADRGRDAAGDGRVEQRVPDRDAERIAAEKAAAREREQAQRQAEADRKAAEQQARRDEERRQAEAERAEKARRAEQERADKAARQERERAEREAARAREQAERAAAAARKAEAARPPRPSGSPSLPRVSEQRVEASATKVERAVEDALGDALKAIGAKPGTSVDRLNAKDRDRLLGKLNGPAGRKVKAEIERFVDDNYPTASEADRAEFTRSIMRGLTSRLFAPTKQVKGRGTRLAVRALERKAAARQAGDHRAAAQAAREQIGDPADFARIRVADRGGYELHPDDLDPRDGQPSEKVLAKLEAVRTAGAAISAAVDDLLKSKPGGGTRAERAAARVQVLAQVRSMGPKGDQRLNFEFGRIDIDEKQVKAMLAEAEKVFPTDWLARNRDRGTMNVTAAADRAHYTAGGHRLEVGRKGDVERRQAVVIHELGHSMETTSGWLAAAQRAYLQDRTSTGPIGSRRRDQPTKVDDQDTYKDDLPDQYSGKTYSFASSHELLSTGIESLLGAKGPDFTDADFEQFVLGMMATL